MKKINQILVLLAAVILLNSCGKSFLADEDTKRIQDNDDAIQTYLTAHKLTAQKSTGGVYYVVTKANPTGKMVTVGDQVVLHYVETLLDGTVIDSSSVLNNKPAQFTYGVSYSLPAVAVLDAVANLHVGEKATLFLTSNLAYGSQSSSLIPAYSVLKFDVTIVGFNSEDQQIQNYITAKSLTLTETTSTGLRYIRTLASTGDAVKAGQTVTINYTGKYLSDAQFDTGSFSYVLGTTGTGGVIKGFDEAVSKMKVGEKATFIIPSAIGYGTAGSGAIPPYTPLVFFLELVSVK